MEKPIDFQERRKKFLNQNKAEIEIPTFMQNRNKETYTAKKEDRRRVQKNIKKNKKKILAKRIATVGLVGLIAFGGYKYYQDYQKENNSITLEQALDNGESLNSLKIDSSIENQLESIKEELSNNEMTNQELVELSTDINELQFDTLKTKLAKTLGVSEEDIKLYTKSVSRETGETYQSVEVQGGETYSKKELFKNNNTISDDISTYIKNIGEMQTLMGKMQKGDIDRNSIMKEYKSTIKEIDTMAAAKMSIDSKGNIRVDKINKKDLAKENDKTSREDKQIEDDGMELE